MKKTKKNDPEDRERERRAFWERIRGDAETIGKVAEALLPFSVEQRIRILRMAAIHFGLDGLDQELRAEQLRRADRR